MSGEEVRFDSGGCLLAGTFTVGHSEGAWYAEAPVLAITGAHVR